MFLPSGAREHRIRNGTPCHIFTANEENVEVRKNLWIMSALTF